jgi:glycosyltransferase involved in cell wall biosynthesis
MLADILRRRYRVELVGPMFKKEAVGVWPPLREVDLPIRILSGGKLPEFLKSAERFVARLDADLVYVSKPRLPSLAVGMLAKEIHGVPVVIDVDDREIAFPDVSPRSVKDLRAAGQFKELRRPLSSTWTAVCDRLVEGADGVTVASPQLQATYGGVIVPHARDERVFDPSLYDRAVSRARLGFVDRDKVVLFVGSPRAHKGVVETACAVRALSDPHTKFCVLGSATSAMAAKLREAGGSALSMWPDQPFARLPETVLAGDLVCLLQDTSSEVARYQMPAKLTDALAMGTPVVASGAAPLIDLNRRGVLALVDRDSLSSCLSTLLEDPGGLRTQAAAGRNLFLAEYSYAATLPRLEAVVEQAMAASPRVPHSWVELLAFVREQAASLATSKRGARRIV